MLEFVIKRDGTEEPFSVEKINQWALYSARQHNIQTGEWNEAVQRALQGKSDKCTTQALQRSLIQALLEINTWGAMLMAGTLEASMLHKELYPNGFPTVREQFIAMANRGIMIRFDFDDDVWAELDNIIDHDKDKTMPQFSIVYIRDSYALTDVVTKKALETPQFSMMRKACAIGATYPKEEMLDVIREMYFLFSEKVLSSPTPSWTSLGTPNNGLASCCLYTAKDDRRSLAAADHISYVMTYMSAGLGYHHSVRSVGDPVRGGTIEHQGETGYLKSIAAAAAANRQKKRGGAVTGYVSAYSKEAEEVINARSPLAAISKALHGIDIATVINDDLLTRAIKSQPAMHFTQWSHPELYALMHKPNWNKEFEKAMAEEIAKDMPESELFNPRQVISSMGKIAYASGRLYSFFVDNANSHTSYKEPIYSSNLCLEIMQPTKPYSCTSELYRADDEVAGEVSLCSIAAINHNKVADDPGLHRRACMGALRLIDYCIHHGHYELPHIGYTAKKRNNAGVGVMNTAAYMARKGLTFNSPEGLKHAHEFSERQSYYLIEASLQLGKEKGNAEWMHKTRWTGYTNKDGEYVKAWMPIDTGNARVANELGIELKMDWEDLRDRVAANGGIRNSSLFSVMPGESSSKALGASNSIYPVRELGLDKTDSSSRIDWLAEGAGSDEYQYQIAFDLSEEEIIRYYSVWQRFIDQGISADFWKDFSQGNRNLKTNDILKKYKLMHLYGLKSHYYVVPKTQRTEEEMRELADMGGASNVPHKNEDIALNHEGFNAAVCGIDSPGGCSA